MAKELCVQLVPLFNQLPLTDQEQIEALLKQAEHPRDEIVLDPLSKPQLIIVAKGKLRMETLASDGTKQVNQIIGAGDYAGTEWLFGETNQVTYLTATQNSLVCHLEMADFKALLAKLPALAYRLLRFTINQNHALQRQTYYLGLTRVEGWVMAYFNDQKMDQQSSVITLPFKLADLAAYLGTTPETISRTIKHLSDETKIEQLTKAKYRLLKMEK